MKQTFLFIVMALMSAVGFAQTKYPKTGVFKQISIEGGGRTLKDLPLPTYRSCNGDRTLIFWVQPRQEGLDCDVLIWRAEFISDVNDPFGVKLSDVTSDSFTLSWYNATRDFYDFPAGIWINEVWEKVKGESIPSRISAAATNHKNRNKLEGSWKLVANQALDLPGEPTLPGKNTYKIYAPQVCLSFMGSLYNIEQGGRSFLRDFKWTSENEFIEAGVEHKVTFVNPSVITLEFKNEKYGRMKETWIRYDIPEPMASLLSNFRD